MFRAQPKTELSKFINAYKSASSRLLKKEYPEIRENRADGKIEHTHNHNKVKTNSANRRDQAGLKITQHIGRRTKIARRQSFKNRPGKHYQTHQDDITLGSSRKFFLSGC